MALHLITGATGLVGKALVAELRAQGHQVRILSTRKSKRLNPEVIYWDPESGWLDPESLRGIDVLHHLAGASVAAPWTAEHRYEIRQSRVRGTALLVSKLQQLPESDRPHTAVCASAVGIYPDRWSMEPPLRESDGTGVGFLADVVREWESATDQFRSLGLRTVQLRIGMVLGKGGALDALLPLFRSGLGAPVGNGKQWMPWIHVEDLARAFVHAAETPSLNGVYNAVGKTPSTNKEFSRTLARVLKKPFWAPAPPAWIFKIALGERSALVLSSTPASSEKLCSTGFTHRYPELEPALRSLLS